MNVKRKNMNKGAAILFTIFALLFFLLIIRFVTIQTTGEAGGKVLAEKAAQKYLKTGVLEAHRGSILDQNGEVIAEDTASYTLVAVLDPSATANPKHPNHVIDKEKTAGILAKYLDMSEADILSRLSKKNAYQVEFGGAGRDISHVIKKKIEAEKLPGLIFTQDTKRFYPNGTFASHLVGFAQKEEDKEGISQTVGKMGIEESYNDLLKGKNGSIQYKSDLWGYLLPNSNEMIKEPKDGKDIYLTLDKKIQTFMEDSLSRVEAKYHPKKMWALVMDPKTGKILAMGQRPTFSPSSREGLSANWHNINVESSYEPGSTFKSFSLASAVQEGVFNPNATYQSGEFHVDGNPAPIKDWNYGQGWGRITYLEGLQRSSNVAFANLLGIIGPETYRKYLDKFGFGQSTNSGLPNEATGKILYRYPIEKITTIFGQGTTVTPLQIVQAESAIANDGKMMKPYVVDKIVDPNTDKVVKKTEPEVVGQPISADTAKQVRDYLRTTVTSEVGTGIHFAIDGYEVAGKSGTAQMPGPDGRYLTGRENYIFSFLGMAPKDDPQLIVYVAVQQPELPDTEIGSDPVAQVFNPVMKNSLQYLNIKPTKIQKAKEIKVQDWVSESVVDASAQLKKDGIQPVILGTGSYITGQLPKKGTPLIQGEKVLFMTDGPTKLPSLTGWSLRDILLLSNLTKMKVNVDGNGYVYHQSIPAGSAFKEEDSLIVKLESPQTTFEKKKKNDEEKKSNP